MRGLTSFLFFAAVAVPGTADAVTYNGGNWGGANLVVANGDMLNGVFTNVGTFQIPAGVTVGVQPTVELEIYANSIVIDGTLNGNGAGLSGGIGAPQGPVDGGVGSGSGAGSGGKRGPCVHGGGGGGAGYGGLGGDGGYHFTDGSSNYPNSGGVYGTPGGGTTELGSAAAAADRAATTPVESVEMAVVRCSWMRPRSP